MLPAVDVVEGRAVRLVQGKAGSETEYGSALEAALTWQRDGAEWIHLVDLDAAFGRGSNRELLAEVVAALDVKVEMSGGIRDDESLRAALATGCARVNIGTAALENPEWCARAIGEYGERVAVGLDVQIVDGDPRVRLFEGLAHRRLVGGLAVLHETGRHRPQPESRLDRTPAHQDLVPPVRDAPGDHLGIVIVHGAAVVTDVPRAVVALRNPHTHQIPTYTAELHRLSIRPRDVCNKAAPRYRILTDG